jgi:hypothetical protein
MPVGIVGGVMHKLSGCSTFKSQFADRYGPDPVLTEAPTSNVAARQGDVVTALLLASGYRPNLEPPIMPSSPAEWYGVILTGFNVVDDACQTYINDLWKIDREKNRIKDVITASGAATAAIVGANANPSARTLTTLASAFGLASAMTSAIGDSYLFAQDPSSVGQIVKKLQVAYRNDIASNVGKPNYPISSYSAVYYHTREYLSLCLPPTIEAQVQDLVAKAKATPDAPTAGAPGTPKTLSLVGKPVKATSSISLSPGS